MKSPIFLGYYPDWTIELPVEKIPYAKFTHLVHAFARFDAQKKIIFPSEAQSNAFCSLCRKANVTPLLAVGGEDSGNRLLAAWQRDPNALVQQLKQRVTKFGYSGIDIDWEFPDALGGSEALTAFVLALRVALPKATLTAAVPAGDYYGKYYNAAKLLPYLDFLNLMAYDAAGPWSEKAAHNAPLSYAQSAIDYWVKKCPPEKLLLGLAAYGRGFRATKFGDAASKSYERSEVGYRELLVLEKQGWRKAIDAAAQSPVLLSPSGTEIIGFDDADSIHRKSQLAKSAGLAGVFFWQIAQDTESSVLLNAARSAWGKK
jgi:chitinase